MKINHALKVLIRLALFSSLSWQQYENPKFIEKRRNAESKFSSVIQVYKGVVRRCYLQTISTEKFILDLFLQIYDEKIDFLKTSVINSNYNKISNHSEINDLFLCKFMICYHYSSSKHSKSNEKKTYLNIFDFGTRDDNFLLRHQNTFINILNKSECTLEPIQIKFNQDRIKNLKIISTVGDGDFRDALNSEFIIICINKINISESIEFNYIICDTFVYFNKNFSIPDGLSREAFTIMQNVEHRLNDWQCNFDKKLKTSVVIFF
jgi:hypothetical protein